MALALLTSHSRLFSNQTCLVRYSEGEMYGDRDKKSLHSSTTCPVRYCTVRYSERQFAGKKFRSLWSVRYNKESAIARSSIARVDYIGGWVCIEKIQISGSRTMYPSSTKVVWLLPGTILQGLPRVESFVVFIKYSLTLLYRTTKIQQFLSGIARFRYEIIQGYVGQDKSYQGRKILQLPYV
ncbi:hypothetical protein BGX38DRAFT_484939 [Terfezia claveryi]|nr:hypothetical protein BGX38DRAFT_484939 [Terfezia claveryi]